MTYDYIPFAVVRAVLLEQLEKYELGGIIANAEGHRAVSGCLAAVEAARHDTAINLVTCRDCMYSRPKKNPNGENIVMLGCAWCDLQQRTVLPTSFCSSGERKKK